MSAWGRTWRAYLGIWALTATAAALLAISDPLAVAVRNHDALALRPGTARSAATVAAIAAHNLIVVGWPAALAALGLASWRYAVLFDAAVIASAAANSCMAGAALGAYGVALVPWLVHLPIEWAALALGVAAWWAARSARTAAPALARALVVTCIAAAVVEVLATP